MSPADPHARPHARPHAEEQACQDFVELVTAYLDGALPDDVRTAVDEHLGICPGCGTLLDQWRTVVALTGRLTDADVAAADELTRDRLLTTFRRARRR